MDNSRSMNYSAGQAQGKAEVHQDQIMDQAANSAQAIKENCQEAGQQMMSKAQGATDAVKDTTGMNK